MALAGAKRIFTLIDEKPENDDGNVVLVNANKDENGNITESDKYTGLWAWKYIDDDGRIKYIELKGHIELENVDFSYVPEKRY